MAQTAPQASAVEKSAIENNEQLSQSQKVIVGIAKSPPFVMFKNDKPVGLAIDLWEGLAKELGLVSEYRQFHTFRELVNAVETNEIDISVVNLIVTESRAKRIDFTQPWFDDGLRIMVNANEDGNFWEIIRGLSEAGFLQSYFYIFCLVMLATLVMVLFYRHFDKGFTRSWLEGLAESFYTVMQVLTTGKLAPGRNFFGWVGRIFQGIWLLVGVGFIAYITSSVTSVMTTVSLTSQINGLRDLSGRTIGVLDGTVAEEFAKKNGMLYLTYADLDESIEALKDRQISAVIEDASALEYYAKSNPEMGLRVVGKLFDPNNVAFGLPHNSALRRPLNVEILAAEESDEIEDLKIKYFGEQ